MAKMTKHGKKRMKQRAGISGNSAEKIMNRVIKHGINHRDTKGILKSWIDSICIRHKDIGCIKLYGGMIYLFKHKNLVTTYPIPNNMWNNPALIDKEAYEKYDIFMASKCRKKKGYEHENKSNKYRMVH